MPVSRVWGDWAANCLLRPWTRGHRSAILTARDGFRSALRMPLESTRRCFQELSWPQVEQAVATDRATLIWPFGACEQHGPHLPLVTDALFADRLLDAVLQELPEESPIWRLPVQTIGFSPEHGSFPGTLTLSAGLLISMVVELGEQLAAMGWRRLVLFNAHGGQIALLQVAARELRKRCPSLAVLPCFLWSGVEGLASLIPQPELSDGLHAGLAETSLMQHLAPSLVSGSRPVDGLDAEDPSHQAPSGWSLEGAAPCAWLTSDVSSSGVIGDSRGATAELGAELETLLIQHWIQMLQSLVDSDWPPRPMGAGDSSGS